MAASEVSRLARDARRHIGITVAGVALALFLGVAGAGGARSGGSMRGQQGHARATLSALVAVVFMLVTAASTADAAGTSGSERFDGGLVVSNPSGKRTVAGSVIAMSGVFNGLGRIVERPNRRGDSAKISRDDLVFAAGTLHIVNTDRGHPSLAVNRRTCTATFRVQKTTKIAGGTGRFAGATGTFVGAVSGSAVARRNADGSCDQQHAALVEIDTVTGAGTLTF